MIEITECPSCGSAKIRKVRQKWTGVCGGQPYTVDDLEFYECPVCRERVYYPEAMRAIEGISPAFAKSTATASE